MFGEILTKITLFLVENELTHCLLVAGVQVSPMSVQVSGRIFHCDDFHFHRAHEWRMGLLVSMVFMYRWIKKKDPELQPSTPKRWWCHVSWEEHAEPALLKTRYPHYFFCQHYLLWNVDYFNGVVVWNPHCVSFGSHKCNIFHTVPTNMNHLNWQNLHLLNICENYMQSISLSTSMILVLSQCLSAHSFINILTLRHHHTINDVMIADHWSANICYIFTKNDS